MARFIQQSKVRRRTRDEDSPQDLPVEPATSLDCEGVLEHIDEALDEI